MNKHSSSIKLLFMCHYLICCKLNNKLHVLNIHIITNLYFIISQMPIQANQQDSFFRANFHHLATKKNPVQLIQRIFVKKCTKSCQILRKKFPKSAQLHNMHSFSHAQIFRCTTTESRHNSLEQEHYIDNLLFRISAKPSTSLEIYTHTQHS